MRGELQKRSCKQAYVRFTKMNDNAPEKRRENKNEKKICEP